MAYTIMEVSEKTGISSYTLRYYEKEGVLPFVQRSSGGIRYYSDGDLDWVWFIKCLKDTGMSVSDMKQIVQLSLMGDHTIPERKRLLEEHREAILQKQAEMNRYMVKIEHKLAWYTEMEEHAHQKALEQQTQDEKRAIPAHVG